MSNKNVKTQKPTQETIDALFQEISDDLMQSINGGFAVAVKGVCHGQLAQPAPLAVPTYIGK